MYLKVSNFLKPCWRGSNFLFLHLIIHVVDLSDVGWRIITCGVIGEGRFNISLCASMLAVTTNLDDDSGGDDELSYI